MVKWFIISLPQINGFHSEVNMKKYINRLKSFIRKVDPVDIGIIIYAICHFLFSLWCCDII